MSPRDDDLAKLAGLCGWWFFTAVHDVKPAKFILTQAEERREIHIPAPDAPLPEALAFVGRIAEAVGYERDGLTIQFRIGPSGNPLPEAWRVTLGLESDAAPDLAWAACRAAIAARQGGTDGHS